MLGNPADVSLDDDALERYGMLVKRRLVDQFLNRAFELSADARAKQRGFLCQLLRHGSLTVASFHARFEEHAGAAVGGAAGGSAAARPIPNAHGTDGRERGWRDGGARGFSQGASQEAGHSGFSQAATAAGGVVLSRLRFATTGAADTTAAPGPGPGRPELPPDTAARPSLDVTKEFEFAGCTLYWEPGGGGGGGGPRRSPGSGSADVDADAADAHARWHEFFAGHTFALSDVVVVRAPKHCTPNALPSRRSRPQALHALGTHTGCSVVSTPLSLSLSLSRPSPIPPPRWDRT